MDWIKKNYEQAILIALAIILLAVSVLLILRVLDFQSVFAGIQGNVPQSKKIDPVEIEPIQQGQARVAQPPAWNPSTKSLLFVTERWVLDAGTLKALAGQGAMINPPIPNEWFQTYDLELLDPDILTQDADRDGFTNLEEFQGGVGDNSGAKSTDPTKKESHPPYTTKLFLQEYKEIEFLITYKARPDEDTFQINIPGRRSQFVHIGDVIVGGPQGKTFKVLSHEEKAETAESDTVVDVSELTIQDEESGKKIVLIKGQTVNDPESYVILKYLWNDTDLRLSKDQVFTLKPDEETEYKMLDFTREQATIENLKTGEKLIIRKLPQ